MRGEDIACAIVLLRSVGGWGVTLPGQGGAPESDLRFMERGMPSIIMVEATPIALASFLDEIRRERQCIH